MASPLPSAATLAQGQGEEDLTRFLSFVAEYVPKGETALYVTPGTGTQEMWTFYRLSYELYPSAVWWVAPAPREPVTWWITAPLDGPALANLAREKGARYVIVDGVPALEALAGRSVQDRPGRMVLMLDEGQQE